MYVRTYVRMRNINTYYERFIKNIRNIICQCNVCMYVVMEDSKDEKKKCGRKRRSKIKRQREGTKEEEDREN